MRVRGQVENLAQRRRGSEGGEGGSAGSAGGETRRVKSLRIGVHHANAVVWGPVYRTATNRIIGIIASRRRSIDPIDPIDRRARTWNPRSTGPAVGESYVSACPPHFPLDSYSVTSMPFLCARYAALRPATPEPTTATLRGGFFPFPAAPPAPTRGASSSAEPTDPAPPGVFALDGVFPGFPGLGVFGGFVIAAATTTARWRRARAILQCRCSLFAPFFSGRVR
eukprot:31364-Pelagococcus_subviridis.AAC.14